MRHDTWVLEPTGDELVDVLRNGRRLRSGLTEHAARRWIRQQMRTRDRVYLEERDGYRQRLQTV